MTDVNVAAANRVRRTVRLMPGLEHTTMQEVVAVAQGKDIGDPLKTVAITVEFERAGAPLAHPRKET